MKISSTNKMTSDHLFNSRAWEGGGALGNSLALTGRILFSLIFILGSLGHFNQNTINMAGNHGVMYPDFFVPLSGVIGLFGGLSVLFGYYTKIGSFFLIIFLIPITLIMHDFWNMTDVNDIQMQQAMFLKNIALLGGAIHFFYFGAGTVSLDNFIEKKMDLSLTDRRRT